MLDLQNKRILVVAAHPDDEVLGAGGVIHKAIQNNDCQIRVVILGEGLTSRQTTRKKETLEKELGIHQSNIEAAKNVLGYQELSVHQLPDNRFDSIPLLEVIKIIEREKADFGPEMIITHHGGDLNVDHRVTFEAVITASRPLSNETVKSILSFEIPSNTEWASPTNPYQFVPNVFYEMSESDLKAKIEAMQSYDYEKRDDPHPRSPEALEVKARSQGIKVGLKYAEAFQLVRTVKVT